MQKQPLPAMLWRLSLEGVVVGDRWDELAQALANERLALKPESRINRGFLERSKGRAVSGVY
ncbi:hypothetical protein [Advenella alkanexedens]|uniref:hypothetical protein n=1 Tax=Advenella alkanexedens TaxID=1481665 RepID=UPI002674E30E|nr:hypothetical protein [Advenella alkanexedens]WKU19618.1 hypothetical protein Q3V95_00805 [Advenella alkanexedens]